MGIWNGISGYVYNITYTFQIVVFAIAMYYLILGLFGLVRKNNKKEFDPKKKFALIVAAHNEETVIGNMVDSLNKLDYPRELYDIFVIADNCTDKTAEIARSHGANVYERFNKDKRGKGYALEWMFDNIFKMKKKYDAVSIFDADNVVSSKFLREINNKMCEGYKVVQGYIDSKNPSDSWITESYSIAFWSANRFFQLSRANLGLTNQIGGTGFAVDTKILKELGWGATCLTEDLEFTCKLVMNGEKVGWAHDAIVYDEKPLTLKDSWNQRKRWMSGFADVASRFFTKLLKKAFKERSFVMFDCALYVIQPYVTLLSGGVLLLSLIKFITQDKDSIATLLSIGQETFGDYRIYFWMIFGALQFMVTPLILFLDKKISKGMFAILGLYSVHTFATNAIVSKLKVSEYAKEIGIVVFKADANGIQAPTVQYWVVLLITVLMSLIFVVVTYALLGKRQFKFFYRMVWLYMIYTISWIPITVQGIKDKNNKEWSHTKHVRQIGIYEV